MIEVKKNYEYEEPELLKDENYLKLLKCAREINKLNSHLDRIDDSHDMVQFYMILMNHFVAKKLYNNKRGIFRTSIREWR